MCSSGIISAFSKAKLIDINNDFFFGKLFLYYYQLCMGDINKENGIKLIIRLVLNP